MNKDLNKTRTIFRPLGLVYSIGLCFLGYHWFGWWGILLVGLAQVQIEYKGKRII